jgi:hypothetical protein
VSVAIQAGPSEELLKLEERLKPLYAQLANHRLYSTFETIEDLRLFMEAHVFAVWDFMSLLKALQRGLTCINVPWVPSSFPASRRLINEIVLGEESDTYERVGISHFELYCRAMRECGADLTAIDRLLLDLKNGVGWNEALSQSNAPPSAQTFVSNTFEYIEGGKLHVIAAAFTFGREDLIPDMFRGFIRDQDERLSGQLSIFRWYLDRHIEVDGDEHGPLALQMIDDLCDNDSTKWQEASLAAENALQARLALWDGIADAVMESRARR